MAKSSAGTIVMAEQLVASMLQNCRSDEYLVKFYILFTVHHVMILDK